MSGWLPPQADPDRGDPLASPPPAPEVAGPVARTVEWLPRVWAAVVDFFVRLALVLTGSLVGAVGFAAGADGGRIGVLAGMLVGAAIGSILYPVWFIARRDGQTIGHKASNTRIVNADGSSLTGRKAFIREVVVKSLLFEGAGGAILFWIPTALNYLWPLWDERNEALHDKICRTRVVEATETG